MAELEQDLECPTVEQVAKFDEYRVLYQFRQAKACMSAA